MKITKSKLNQIIKEETDRLLREGETWENSQRREEYQNKTEELEALAYKIIRSALKETGIRYWDRLTPDQIYDLGEALQEEGLTPDEYKIDPGDIDPQRGPSYPATVAIYIDNEAFIFHYDLIKGGLVVT